jgi:hypothetical protein
MMSEEMEERLAIRELLENWVVWRDSGNWDRFRTCWHDDGLMMATWFQGSPDEFIQVSRDGFDKGIYIIHFLGGSSIDVEGSRAIAQTKMTISQRAPVDGIPCEVLLTGRFNDFIEKRDGAWKVLLRQPIYEKDLLTQLDRSATLELDADLLARFPVGYRHLAYLQSKLGYDVKRDMPGIVGPEVEALYEASATWLAGGPLDWPPT